MAQKGSKKRKKAQKGSKRRSKRLFEPARCRQCARRGCSSLLRCRLCVRRGCSRLLFEITIRKCWARLHCALSHCTLLCFAPCMYMHGSTLVYIYINKCSRAGPQRSGPHPAVKSISLLRLKNMQKHVQMLHWGHLALKMACSGLLGCRQCARRGCSSLLQPRWCAQDGRSGLPRSRQCARKG